MIRPNNAYSYDDVTIIPSSISNICSRSEVNPFINDMLPIFTAPMTSVVGKCNYKVFQNNHITPIIPRSESIDDRIKLMKKNIWVALSLSEFEHIFIDNMMTPNNVYYICIDIANGHMKSLYKKCIKAKKLASENGYGLILMVGNIANPETLDYICEYVNGIGTETPENVISYVRIGIGGGSGCLTTSNTGIHFPQASLIDECRQIIDKWAAYDCNVPLIIADGGIKNYNDVIKALALGADFVMIGGLFATMLEAAGVKEDFNNFKLYNETGDYTPLYYKLNFSNNNWKSNDVTYFPYNIFYGMASVAGQLAISGIKTKTSEGLVKRVTVDKKLSKWVENMIAYLKSAMSYCNAKDLFGFIGFPELIVNTSSEQNRVNK